MLTGTCALCRKTRPLQSSHLVPAAYYKIAGRSGDSNPYPFIITPNVTLKTSRQVQAHLLCRECEERFNSGGEDWVLKNVWRSDHDFPLQSALFSATPAFELSGTKAFSGRSVEPVLPERLSYFAASVFWRAAVRAWPIAGHTIPKLELGPYEDQLRQFLLNENSFPHGVALIVTVSSLTTAGENRLVSFPVFTQRRHAYRHHNFIVPGLRVEMLTGRALPPAARSMCVVHSAENLIFMSPGMDESSLSAMARVARESRRVN